MKTLEKFQNYMFKVDNPIGPIFFFSLSIGLEVAYTLLIHYKHSELLNIYVIVFDQLLYVLSLLSYFRLKSTLAGTITPENLPETLQAYQKYHDPRTFPRTLSCDHCKIPR